MNVLEEKLSVSKQIVEVPPSDYLSLKKKIQSDSELIYQLEQRCHTLEHYPCLLRNFSYVPNHQRV